MLFTYLGPPGTGKTTWLARQIRRSVERWGPNKVLVASLTTTAASEIVGRGIPVARENVGTLHALCYRILARPPLFHTRLSEFNADTGFSLTGGAGTVDDLQGDLSGTGADDKLFEEISIYRLSLEPEEDMPERLVDLHRAIEAWKDAHGVIDYTDMILHALEAFPTHPADPAAIYYDEAQDGSPAELALIKQWGQHAEACVICGDEDQTLYAWRGASVEAFLSFSEEKRVLSTTWRLPYRVWEYADRWVRQIRVRAEKEYRPKDDAEAGVVERCLARRGSIGPIIDHVAKNPSASVMILATCGYMLSPVLAALRKAGVPFWNPYRRTNGAWNPIVRGDGRVITAADRVVAFLQNSELAEEPRLWTWAELHSWIDPLNAAVLIRGAKATIKAKAEADPGGTPGVMKLEALLGPRVLAHAEAGDLSWYSENTLKAKRNPIEYAADIALRRGAKALTEDPRVVVGTVHSVKGGEADDVFILPDLSRKAWTQYALNFTDEINRTFYVAITRAKRGVYLCTPTDRATVRWLPIEKGQTNEAPF